MGQRAGLDHLVHDLYPFRTTAEVDSADLLNRLERTAHRTTVVVPVFNGGSIVARCLESILRHTPPGTRLIAIDDASTDPSTVALLDEFESNGAIELVRHAENWGYTRTANHGLALARPDDVVLLNCDTEVGPMWLQRLVWTAASRPGVATVSAVSNDAASMSVPWRHQKNVWYPRFPWEATARVMFHGMRVWDQVVPAAHGFCVYVRREALDDLGDFDVVGFPIGYGEEVDFSQRAIRAGWVNLVAPHVLVKHLRSQSFGPRRTELVAAAKIVLLQRYPDYVHEVAMWDTSVGAMMIAQAAEGIRRSWTGPPPLARQIVLRHQGSAVGLSVVDAARRPVRAGRWTGPAPLEAQVAVEDVGARVCHMAVEHGVETAAIMTDARSPSAATSRVVRLLGLREHVHAS